MTFELLKSTEVVVGLVVTFFGAIATVIYWVWGRVSHHVASSIQPITAGNEGIVRRLNELEGDMGEVRSRIGDIEGRMATLASKDDLNALAVSVARVEATSRATDQKVDTLYRAVMSQADRR